MRRLSLLNAGSLRVELTRSMSWKRSRLSCAHTPQTALRAAGPTSAAGARVPLRQAGMNRSLSLHSLLVASSLMRSAARSSGRCAYLQQPDQRPEAHVHVVRCDGDRHEAPPAKARARMRAHTCARACMRACAGAFVCVSMCACVRMPMCAHVRACACSCTQRILDACVRASGACERQCATLMLLLL